MALKGRYFVLCIGKIFPIDSIVDAAESKRIFYFIPLLMILQNLDHILKWNSY